MDQDEARLLEEIQREHDPGKAEKLIELLLQRFREQETKAKNLPLQNA